MTFVSNSDTNSPVFDYSSRDYASVYQDLLNRIPGFLPEWTSQNPNDFGIVLLQMFAYSVDLLSYYIDRLAGEAFIATATQPNSILNIAAMLDYQPQLSAGSTVVLQITISNTVVGPYTIPAGTQFATVGTTTQGPIVFETLEDLVIAGSNGATPSVTGMVSAQQGQTVASEPVGTSDGTINQVFPLAYAPVEENSFTVFVDLGDGPTAWTYTPDLIDFGPLSQVFTTFVDGNGRFYIIFGDGVNGLVPSLGSPITCTYIVGDGALGNVGAGTIIEPVSALPGVIAVTNPLAASGGADAESIQQIQKNAPASVKAVNRAVTVSDIETLAEQASGGVQWAAAEEVTYQLVNLYVSPVGGGNPTDALKASIENYLFPKLMANTTVSFLDPVYVPINISLSILDVLPNSGNASTQAAVLLALQTYLSLPETGFGFRVSLGEVYRVILTQDGVDYAIVSSLYRGMLATLTEPLVSGDTYTQVQISPLPQDVQAGDSIILTDGVHTQALTVENFEVAGQTTLQVDLFTANANYAAYTQDTFPSGTGSYVIDTTGTNDCVLLPNEIPVVGALDIPLGTGGIAGS